MSGISAVVTDIEGTTSSIEFVHDVLFPYAARSLPEFIHAHAGDSGVAPLLVNVRDEAGEPEADHDRVIDILLQWMAEDRKSTPLKMLQGFVWERGYENGDFTGHVYGDTAPNLRRWFKLGVALYVYSSGSVRAQQLLFGHSTAGDLRPLFSGYFDTRIGHKRDVASYRAIIGEIGEISEIGQAPDTILFLSDVVEELDAAALAGMKTTQLVRSPAVRTGRHPVARTFDEVAIPQSRGSAKMSP